MAKKPPLEVLGFDNTGTVKKLGPLKPIGSPDNMAIGFDNTTNNSPAPIEGPTPSKQFTPNYIAGTDLQDKLGKDQDGWSQFGNLLAQTGIEALVGTVEAGSYLADFEQHLNKIRGEEQEYSNWLADEAKALKQQGRTNWFPVYLQEQNEGFQPASAEWWAANGGQGLGSTLALLIPGVGIAKLGKLAGLGKIGQSISAAVASRYAESTMEANQVYEESLAKGASKEAAGDAASKTWNTNWLFALQDFAQFSALSKGLSTVTKGAKGNGFKQLVSQMASEGLEEAGQYITAEEAKRTALNANTDYFGEGFSKRLTDYIHDDEFKTSTLLGTVGGGVFHAAGVAADKLLDVQQGTAIPSVKEKLQNLFSRGIQKEVANATDDKIQSTAIGNIDFTQGLVDHINRGKLDEYKGQLEELKKQPNLDPDARQSLDTHIQNVDFLMTENAKLRNSNVPQELHKPILLKKLEINQNLDLAKKAEKELQETYNKATEQGLNPNLTELKKAKVLADQYRVFAMLNPTFVEKAKQVQAQYEQLLNITVPKINPDRDLKSTVDDKLDTLTYQTISLNEKKPILQSELDSLSTPEGIAAYKQAIANKKINAEATAILTNPNVTKEQLLQAEKNATDPNLKVQLAKKYQELNEKDRQTKLADVQNVVDIEPSVEEAPMDVSIDNIPEDIQPPDVEPAEFDPDDMEPPVLEPEEEIERKKKFGLTPKQVEEIVKSADIETRQPKPVETQAKDIQIKTMELLREKTTVASVALNLNAQGKPITYVNKITGERVPVERVYATDDVTRQLIVNTPRIAIGQEVTLRLEKDFPWVQRTDFESTEDNYTINVYVEGIEKPITSLRSADNKYMLAAEREQNRELRKQLQTISGELRTKIAAKNIGTPRSDSTLRSLEILESDFMQDQEGRWRMQVLPHSPIFGNVTDEGGINVPGIGGMRDIDKNPNIIQRIQTSIEKYFTSADIKKLAGKTITFRTAPDGSLRALGLDYRLLDTAEKNWVRNNLAKLVSNKDFTTLSEVIYIPLQTGGIYINTDDRGRPKTPDLFAKSNGKYVMDRKRFHIASSNLKTELLIPTTATKDNNKPVWISIEDKQLDNFLNNRDFVYRLISLQGNEAVTSDTKNIEPQKIRDLFNKMLEQQFKNVNATHLNSEIQYTDPTNPSKTYATFYDYLVKTNTVQTTLKGSLTLGAGEDSSYSFNQVSIYVDPNPSKTQIETKGETLIITKDEEPQQPTPQEPTPDDVDLEELIRRQFEDDALLKPYTYDGVTFNSIGEEELQWFKDNIGSEFLVVAKNLDKFVSNNGVEAFGQYYNSLVTVAEYAPEGTAYHEAFHFLFDPENGLISKREKEAILSSITEEKLAEEFERYKLSNGQYKPKVEKAKNFFRRLLQMIKNILGLKSPIEKLFSKFDKGTTQEQRDRIKSKELVNPTEPKYKLLQGFIGAKQQEQSIQAFASEVMRLASEAAQTEATSVINILSSKKNLDVIMNQVKNNFTSDFTRIAAIEKKSPVDLARYTAYLAMGIGKDAGRFVSFNGEYEDVKREGLNPIEGFKTKVLKELGNWGFKVSLGDVTDYSKKQLTDEETELQDITTDEGYDNAERLYGIDSTQVNPSESLSQRIRLFLSTIPEPVIEKGKATKKIKYTVFGTPKFVDFKRVDAQLRLKLADSANPIDKLNRLAEFDPFLSVVRDRLVDEKNKGNNQLYTEFFVKYKTDSYIEKTAIEQDVQVFIPVQNRIDNRTYERKNVVKLIDTDRNSVDKSLINKWREGAVNLNMIQTDGTVIERKAKGLHQQFGEFKARFISLKEKRSNMPYTELKDTVIRILSQIGVEIPAQVWEELNTLEPVERYTLLQGWTFGTRDRSIEVMINRYVDGKNPFGETNILTELARRSSIYIEDLARGAYRTEDGKQKFSINTPAYITEFFNQAKQYPNDLVSKFTQDNRYINNEFLNVIKDSTHRSNLELRFTSAIRKGDRDPKSFEQRSEIESMLFRLVSYHNNGGNYAFINIGTPSDKAKQPMASLPKHKQALNFLKTILERNVNYEALRIQQLKEYSGLREALSSKIAQGIELSVEEAKLWKHVQSYPLPTDIKNLKNATSFKYIPELDKIPNLAEAITSGNVDSTEFTQARASASAVIDKFIETEYQSFLKFLTANDIIETKTGNDRLLEMSKNIRIPEGVLYSSKDVREGSFESFLKEFFYNDLAWRFEVSKVFQGDLALYADQDDYYKRQYQLVTPGYKPYTEASDRTTVTRIVFAKQFKVNDDAYLASIASLIKEGITAADIQKGTDPVVQQINKYKTVNKTDAQSYITIDAARSMMMSLGQWTKDHEKVYQFAWKDGITVSQAIRSKNPEEVEATTMRKLAAKVLLQPFKPFVFRDVPIKLPNGQITLVKEQIKDSIVMITPELSNGSDGYKKLLNYMYSNNADIASAEDTVKVGSYGVLNLNNDEWPAPAEWQKRVTNIEDFKFPQFISEEKKEEISGTQTHKLILGNIDKKTKYSEGSGEEIIKKYNKLWERKIAESSESLHKELGLTSAGLALSTDPIKQSDQIFKLQLLLKRELSQREINENYQDLLELEKVAKGLQFTLPISFPAFGPKFQSILTNLWKKEVIKQKSTGYSAVNVADFGIGYSDELKFVQNENEKITEAEIGLPINFATNIGLEYKTHILPNGRIMWDKLSKEQQDALQFILYRIPTSNKSSMIPVRVARITPAHLNNIVVLPGELTVQQGLDFDVDKSQLLRRVLTKDGKVDQQDVDTQLFDVYWSILTNKAHAQELLTPLASPIMESKLEEFKTKNVIEDIEKSNPLTAQSDIQAEIRNKDGKAEIGIASRFNTGHSVLQTIGDYVKVQDSIDISIDGIKYAFDEIGRTVDAYGNLISINHAESQQAALDAAKKPLLAYFNVVKGTMAGFHTMIEFGVPLDVVIDFYMQPVVREWTRFYKHEEQSKNAATEKLLEVYPAVKSQYDLINQGRLKQELTATGLSKALNTKVNDSTGHSARVLVEFLKVLSLSEQMTNINNVLSVDTFSDATSLESLQSFIEQKKIATNPEETIYIDERIFDEEKAPAEGKRLAAFFKHGITDAIEYISQFYPSTSDQYQGVRDTYADMVGEDTITDKYLLKKLNQFTDYFAIQGNSALFRLMTENHPLFNPDPALDQSDYRIGSKRPEHLQWSFFDTNKNLKNVINELLKKPEHAHLEKNALLANLESEEAKGNEVQVLGVRNTDAQTDKSEYINAWWDLFTSKSLDVRVIAHDLVRYAVQTSGFVYSPKSFYDLIPVQYWVQSKASDLWQAIVEQPDVDQEAAVVSFIRHNARNLDRFPTLYGKWSGNSFQSDAMLDVKLEQNRITGFTLKESYKANQKLPKFYRINDVNLGEYRLYESNPTNERQYKEVQPLGGRYFTEVSAARVPSNHSGIRSQRVGEANPWNKGTFNWYGTSSEVANSTLKRYLPEDTNTAYTVLTSLLAHEPDVDSKKNIQKLLENIDKINTPVEIGTLPSSIAGRFVISPDKSNKIIISNTLNSTEADLRHVLLHELNHAYSVGIIFNPKGDEQVNFVRNLERIRVEASKQVSGYSTSNNAEFIAELASNPEFIKKLRRTDLWSRILRAFRKLLGMGDKYDKVLDQYYTVLDQASNVQQFNSGVFNLEQEPRKAVKKSTPIDQMHSNLRSRIKRLKAQGKTATADQLQIKYDQLSKLQETEQMVNYVLLVDKEMEQIKDIYKSLATNPDKINPDMLLPVLEQLTSYKLLNSYNRQIARYPEAFKDSIGDLEVFKAELARLITDVERMTESVTKLALLRSAHVIKNTSSDPNLTIEKVMEELEVADRDITFVSRLWDVGKEIRDKAVSTLHSLIGKVYSNAWRKTQEDLYSTESTPVETVVYMRVPNKNNPGFHYVQRTLKFNKTGKYKALSEYEKWLGKTNSFADKFAPVIDAQSLADNTDGVQFISPWSKRGQEILSIKKDDKDYPLRQFYETFVLGYLASQSNIPLRSMRPLLRIPTIQKSIMETLLEKGLQNKLSSISEQVLNNFRRRYDEYDYYAVDENGNKQEYIPVRYVAKQDGQDGRLNTRQVSLDIATTLTIFENEMNTRVGLDKIVSDLELIKHTVGNRKVLKNTRQLDLSGIGGILTAERAGNPLESGEYEQMEGIQSEAFKAIETGLRQHVYGQIKKEEGAFKINNSKFSVSKLVDSLLKYSGFNLLFGNIAIPLTNIMVGKVGILKEGIGGNIVSLGDIAAGEKLFLKDGIASIRDFGKREKVTKLGRIFSYFNPFEHGQIRGLGTDTSYAKNIFDKIITTGGSIAEFEIGVSSMGAVMHKFKAQKDGKDVSFYEAIDMTKDGKVKLNEGYTYKGKKSISEEDIEEIKDYTLRLYQNIYGVSNRLDKPASNEYAIGRLVNFMRGWLIPGINTRWRTRFYDERLKMDQEGHYLSAIVAFNNVFTNDEGYIRKAVDTLRILTWQSTNNPETLLHPTELGYSEERKEQLINLRQANIRKTMFELYLIVALSALIALGWDDDDDDSYAKYLLVRMRRELVTFISPSTAWQVLRSPTVALSTIDGMSKIFYDAQNSLGSAIMEEDQPVYERGPGKGQDKLWFDVKKQLGLNALTQFEDLDTKIRVIQEGVGK